LALPSSIGRWAEWNGKYRDGIRKFLKERDGWETWHSGYKVRQTFMPGRVAPTSINFITAHDGFTLADLVSYNGKHNQANGENNNDGTNDNDSWNCGAEGWTDDGINALRQRQMKNAVAMLIISQECRCSDGRWQGDRNMATTILPP